MAVVTCLLRTLRGGSAANDASNATVTKAANRWAYSPIPAMTANPIQADQVRSCTATTKHHAASAMVKVTNA